MVNYGCDIHDKEFIVETRLFVKTNACKKGAPNLTSEMFRDWVNREFSETVTARTWLHRLGFSHHKGVYFDGHERDDVVEYRRTFVDALNEIDDRCIYKGHDPRLQIGQKPLIMIHHDKSTFYANADQSFYWSDGTTIVLKQISLGQSIMVSDFIEEASASFLNYNGQQARLLLETQTGYFESNMFLKQVDKAINILNLGIEMHKLVFCLIMHLVIESIVIIV